MARDPLEITHAGCYGPTSGLPENETREEVVAAVRKSMEEFDRGEGRPAREALEELRDKLVKRTPRVGCAREQFQGFDSAALLAVDISAEFEDYL